MQDYGSIAQLLKGDAANVEKGTDIPLQELTLESISYDWIEKCSKVSYLKKALKLIDDDGRPVSPRQLLPRAASGCPQATHRDRSQGQRVGITNAGLSSENSR
jgi:hypothetical protein